MNRTTRVVDDINYLTKLVGLRAEGFNVIDRVEYQIIDDDTQNNLDLVEYEIAEE